MMGACADHGGPGLGAGRLEAASSPLGLLEIRLAGAPEDDAAGHASDRDGNVQLAGHAQDVVFHRFPRM
jgi:hypothetical protein